MRNLLRILLLAALAGVTGAGIYGLIYAPRFFKVGAILLLMLTVYIVYALVKNWLGHGKKTEAFTEAEIVDEEQN